MIVVSSQLHEIERTDLRTVDLYLKAQRVADDALLIAPDGDPTPPTRVEVRYCAAAVQPDYADAEVRLPLADGVGSATMKLPDAKNFAIMLTAHGWAAKAATVARGDTMKAVFDKLVVNEAQYWRSAVIADGEGRHVAPDGDGFALYHVDTRGQIKVIARSAELAPLVTMLAATRAAERIDLSGKLGALRPE